MRRVSMNQRRWNPGIERGFQIEKIFDKYSQDGKEFQTEEKEEGVIKEKELERSVHKEAKAQDQPQPSQAFLAELMETQGELYMVISNLSGAEQEVDLENMDLGLGEGNNFETDVGMGLEEHNYDEVSLGNHETLGVGAHVTVEEKMEGEVQT
ncbi:hypothetical protein HID58_034862 [Brassica napus]|uniref:Uncharacterized protein n=1 Tax=Brassica napus TaxID=3708 RepID=A0ABQ8C576_BRANA|nr:hypothetical protein HID58_034862 [Brassica napus]